MKPKAPSEHEDGLLEYLEDIIGTSKYKEPIDEAMVEVERLQEERQIKMNRLRLVEKEKAALEERKKEAEDFIRLRNELVKARSREIQWYLWKLLARETSLKAQLVGNPRLVGVSYPHISPNRRVNTEKSWKRRLNSTRVTSNTSSC